MEGKMNNKNVYYLSNLGELKNYLKEIYSCNVIDFGYYNSANLSDNCIFIINAAYFDILIDFIKRNKEKIYIFSHTYSLFSHMKAIKAGANYFYLYDNTIVVNNFIHTILENKPIVINIDNDLKFKDLLLLKEYLISHSIKSIASKLLYTTNGLSSEISKIYKKIGISGINQFYVANINLKLFSRDDFSQYFLYTIINNKL